jgi:hypothetical protein
MPCSLVSYIVCVDFWCTDSCALAVAMEFWNELGPLTACGPYMEVKFQSSGAEFTILVACPSSRWVGRFAGWFDSTANRD